MAPSRSIWSLLLLASFGALSLANPLSKRFLNPNVITSNFPDPSLLNVNGVTYVFATNNKNNGATLNVPYSHNSDFANANGWAPPEHDAFPTMPSWVKPGTIADHNVWAPDVNKRDDGTYVMYYSAVSIATGTHCLGAATSTRVTGPYTDSSKEALYCPPVAWGGAIDSSGFRDADGTRYMVYKIDGASSQNHSSPLLLQKMKPNLLRPHGKPVVIFNNAGASDKYNVEAPVIVKPSNGAKYFLFFSSGSTFGTSYTISYVSSSNIAGPYGNRQVLLDGSSNTCGQTFVSPGGADVSPLNNRIVFHQGMGGVGGLRQMSAATIAFDGPNVSIVC